MGNSASRKDVSAEIVSLPQAELVDLGGSATASRIHWDRIAAGGVNNAHQPVKCIGTSLWLFLEQRMSYPASHTMQLLVWDFVGLIYKSQSLGTENREYSYVRIAF